MAILDKRTNGRRDELTIMTDLLTNMLEPKRLTHLLYGTNLSYGQLRKYLASLLHMGLAEEVFEPFRAFRITEKGRSFMFIVANKSQSAPGKNEDGLKVQADTQG